MLEVRMEKIPTNMSEKKTARPTILVVKQVLEAINARGVWNLRVQKRLRKKVQERFKAVRPEYAGSYRTIRVCCKPGGNDTAYEYLLVPPSFCDVQTIFDDLCTIHPKTLHRSRAQMGQGELAVLGGVVDRVIRDLPPVAFPLKPTEKVPDPASELIPGDVRDEASEEPSSDFVSPDHVETDPGESSDFVSPDQVETQAREWSNTAKQSKESVGSEATTMISSLDIKNVMNNGMLLSESPVLDRALIAIAFVTRSGYATRVAISDSITQELNIKGFVDTSDMYKSLEGANRALFMGLCDEKLLDRVTNSKDTLKGYRLTAKGEKRIMALRGFLSPGLSKRIPKDWSDGIYDEAAVSCESVDDESVISVGLQESPESQAPTGSPKDIAAEFSDDYISSIESFAKELRVHNENAMTIKKLMEEAIQERDDLSTYLSGVDLTITAKTKERDDLDADISRMKIKKAELEKKIKAKNSDIESCKDEIEEFNKKKAELEAAMRRIGIRG